MTLGDGQNPFILNAVYQEEASLYNVNQIMGELLPQVTLDAQYQQRFGQSNTLKEQQVTTIMGRVNVPLYQGGGVAARIRQAKETNNQLKKEVEDARLRIHAEVISNWGVLHPPRRRSHRRRMPSRPTTSRSTACARRRRSASAPP